MINLWNNIKHYFGIVKWYKYQWKCCQAREDDVRKRLTAETARANKNYLDHNSICIQNWKLMNKLERSKEWNKKMQVALQKMKEQSKLDHEMITKLKNETITLPAKLN